ncbi:MAG: type II secretion system F family protein [Gammaproteobacteria bacterium]|nr:type II secretion system F family protein [Rhodocyclaceae bacterium]MBU3910332.1 type II secretion system F family protein [Gammaproteobacteria bacterium]MBU3990262.1 type II secretion system F family protein [Gammaproteobacteria bacterium]MBU4004159.1 type II secretion system F family protein [Gammaproteobacteria bacterium]MBU4020406.1 type II secretion system F family protein [Gammaproteobacteria bacterium]
MHFAVRALGSDGVVSMTVDAVDAAAARTQVCAQTLRPLSVIAAEPKRRAQGGQFSLPIFSQELLGLLEAGLSLTETIDALREKEQRAVARAVLEKLSRALNEGLRFSVALEAQPEHFPALYIGLMRAAERTSSLPDSLARYIEYRSRLDSVRSRVISALIYPVILAAVGLLVTLFLLGYVVPRFAAVYQGTGRELPWLSQQLIAWGTFASSHVQALMLGGGGLLVAALLAGRTWWRGGGLLRLLRRLPGVGNTVATFELTRLYLSLGTLLDGGLPILQAMQLAEGLLSAETLVRYRTAAAAIGRGESVSQAFEAAALITPVALRLLRVGERSGQLGAMMGRAARFHDGEIARRIDVFARTFEPLLMMAIGLVVGTIVVLLYMPIFDLAGSL